MSDIDFLCRNMARFGFEASALQAIDRLIGQYAYYGRNIPRLLRPEQGFLAHYNDNFVLLENFFELTPEPDGRLQSACWPLSRMVGKYLLNHPAFAHYTFASVGGNCPHYFPGANSSHTFLLMWPKSLDHSMRRHLVTMTYTGEFPEGCVFICPSFKVMGSRELPQGFTLKRLEVFMDQYPEDNPEAWTYVKPMPFIDSHVGSIETPIIPLNFLKNLVSRSDLSRIPLPAETLISLSFRKMENLAPPEPIIWAQPTPTSELVPWVDWKRFFSAKSDLKRLLDKIHSDFVHNPPHQSWLLQHHYSTFQAAPYMHALVSKQPLMQCAA